jgi:hypothetical protein
MTSSSSELSQANRSSTRGLAGRFEIQLFDYRNDDIAAPDPPEGDSRDHSRQLFGGWLSGGFRRLFCSIEWLGAVVSSR